MMMPAQTNLSLQVAEILLKIQAIHFSVEDPFTLTSGKKSPVYVDCRKIISFPEERRFIMQAAAHLIEKNIPQGISHVCGGETAGIPYASWISDLLNVPMSYVRKKPKNFGRGEQIEGVLSPKDRVLLVEDLASEGSSKIFFVEALRKIHAHCHHIFVIFFYNTFPQTQEKLKNLDVTLHYLCTWQDVLTIVRQKNLLPHVQLKEIEDFLYSPSPDPLQQRPFNPYHPSCKSITPPLG